MFAFINRTLKFLYLAPIFCIYFYSFSFAQELRFEIIYKLNLDGVAVGKALGGRFYTKQKCEQPLWNSSGTRLSFYLTDVESKNAVICSFDQRGGIVGITPVFTAKSSTEGESLITEKQSENPIKTKIFTWK